MERMRAPSVPLNPPPVLTDDQSALLLAACRGTDLIARRDLAMLSLLLDTGIRRGELAALRLGDLNLGQRLAFIEASASKSRRGRAVVYGDSTAKALMLPPPPKGAARRRGTPLDRPNRPAADRQRDLPYDRPAGAPGRPARPSPSAAPHLGLEHALRRPQRGRRHAARRLDRSLDAVALRRVGGSRAGAGRLPQPDRPARPAALAWRATVAVNVRLIVTIGEQPHDDEHDAIWCSNLVRRPNQTRFALSRLRASGCFGSRYLEPTSRFDTSVSHLPQRRLGKRQPLRAAWMSRRNRRCRTARVSTFVLRARCR